MNTLIIEHAEDRAKSFADFIEKAGSSVTIWRPYLEAQPDKGFDAILLTGGPMSAEELSNSKNVFFQNEITVIKKAIDNNVPVLGVCLGFQLLCYLLGGKVVFKQPWLRGWLPQNLTKEGIDDPLFKNVPKIFYVFEYHQDKVIKLPTDAALLVTSNQCPIEAFGIKNKPVWGIQFHPEISAKKTEEIFLERADMFRKDGLDIEAEIRKGYQYYSPILVQQIFSNFIQQVAKGIDRPLN